MAILKSRGAGDALLLLLACGAIFLQVSSDGAPAVNGAARVMDMPSRPFDPARAVPAPDYADDRYWAAIPGLPGPAAIVPEGLDDAVIQGQAPVDVFFIHPTGYLSGASWTSPLDEVSATEENTEWMMAYQASVFNGCCNIYAPRYREASVRTYLLPMAAARDEIFGFAYGDVEAAFAEFIDNRNDGRPFILAAHSQGTHHALRLISEHIDQAPIRSQMIVAYLLGSTVVTLGGEWLDRLENISVCESATQTGCLIHWDTVAEGGATMAKMGSSVCTNPLTWQREGERAPASLHEGGLPVRQAFNLDFSDGDVKQREPIASLGAPIPNLTWAECRNGLLHTAWQRPEDFIALNPRGNYHLLDYPLFYMNIRNNAAVRIEAYRLQLPRGN